MMHPVCFPDSANLLHDRVDLFVVQCLRFILQVETYGIRFLSGRQILAFVNVEQGNLLQQFAFLSSAIFSISAN